MSDLHIASEPRRISIKEMCWLSDWRGRRRFAPLVPPSHEPLMLQAAANFAWRDRSAFDLVLLTGDLATTGSLHDLNTALSFVDAEGARGSRSGTRPTLAATGIIRRLLPGNHDRYEPPDSYGRAATAVLPRKRSIRRPFGPAYGEFDRVFGHRWTVKRGVQRQVVLSHQGERPLAVLSADFTLRPDKRSWSLHRWFDYLGQGEADAPLREKLAAETRAVREQHPEAGVVWAIHFAPEFARLARSNRLLHGSELMKLARELDVRHIFCGHTHIARSYKPNEGLPNVHCVGSLSECACSDGNTLFVHRVAVNSSTDVRVETSEFKYARLQNRFIEPSRIVRR